jgi:RNA polymerase sigma factor (TIGR02999 family)
MGPAPGEVTVLLNKIRAGEIGAQDRLAELIYADLRHLAASKMRWERPDHTLSPTGLANEAWLRLAGCAGDLANRSQFFGVAANVMRRILVEHARARKARKRGGEEVLRLQDVDPAAPVKDYTLLALDEALEMLSNINPRAARVVEMRYFSGLTHSEIADVLHLERRTVDRDWALARAWLFDRLTTNGRHEGDMPAHE